MRVISVGRFLTFALLLLGAGGAVGQTKQAGPGGKRAALIIASDVPCTVRLDGETVAELQPDAPAKLLVVPGQYLLAAVSADGQRWSKAVTVKGPKTVIKIEFVLATASPARPASTIPAAPKAPKFVESVDGPGIAFIMDIPADRLSALGLAFSSVERPMCSISGPEGSCLVEAFAWGESKGDSTAYTCKKLDAATYSGHCVDGTLQGVALVRAIGSEKRFADATLAYFSRGRITFPCLVTFLDTLLLTARTERLGYGCVSFGKWDQSDTRENCLKLKAIFGPGVMKESAAQAIRDGSFDLIPYTEHFARWAETP